MYLRESKQRRADGSVVTYLQLAENVWDAAKGRSQASIAHNCGHGDDPEVVERLRGLAKSILRRCSPEEIVGAGGDWRLICAWPHGDLYVLETLWKRLGIDEGGILRRREGGVQPALGAGQRPQGGRRAPAHETALGNIAVGIALTHAHQGLSLVVHFDLPPAHQLSSEKSPRVASSG